MGTGCARVCLQKLIIKATDVTPVLHIIDYSEAKDIESSKDRRCALKVGTTVF